MTRLSATFDRLRSHGSKAMGLFVTNGFPEPDATLPILRAIDDGGADFIELGMPFSDPLAEGLPIQRASARALSHGVTLADAFSTAAAFRRSSETPLLLMGYVNPIYRYGISNFCEAAASSGVDGLILPDLPPEEHGLIARAARDHGLALVNLVAPNTPDERVARIDDLTDGFVYAVSVTGLTGAGLGEVDAVRAYLRRVRALVTKNPLLVGFGIRSHDDAARLSESTDGFIVGSALIEHVAALWDDPALSHDDRLRSVRRFAETLKRGRTQATEG